MRRMLLLVLAAVVAGAQEYTRGIGVYPGDPKEDFSPVIAVEAGAYRNLALHRPAYHSTSYDYNLTAQLITDGIYDGAARAWVSFATSDGAVPRKSERELALDDNVTSTVTLRGAKSWMQIGLEGGTSRWKRIASS